ncbi:hypothetical protein B0H13DRAFT_1945582 [Mycena leptocephala]|nr:hypothetical protein B0H13DRAFT_1945582 [Mycena leptocephala]
MYSWPTNHTQTRKVTLHRKGNAKSKEKVDQPNYPVLDHGTLVAATLLEDNDRLEWTQITRKPSKEPALLKTGKPVTVFPATRPPPLEMPRMTILQRSEQGANFLQTYVPDIDIAAELIRDQLTEDAKVMRQLEDFDPYVGNQLEAFVRSDSSSKQSAFLAFPMGELSRDLNISPLLFSEGEGASLRPSAQAIRTFDTPIQQISASKLNSASRKQGTYLSVRTFGATSLLEVKTPASGLNPEIRVKELGSITSSDTGDKQVVDVKLSASPLDMTLVNNQGAVYKYDGNKTRLVRQATLPISSDQFWRLESTGSTDSCLLMSKHFLKELDFRTKDSSVDIYAAIPMKSYFYQMLRLCTTNQVIWIDRRNTVKPLLAFKHGRTFDRSLEAKTIAIENGHLTTLTSRKNGLLTIYDISRSQGSMALGSIRAFQLSVTDVGEVSFEWTEDVQRLHAQSALLQEEISLLGSRDPTTVDMAPAYEHIFRAHRQRKSSSYWQDLNEPVDRVLTTYDVLFRSGDEPRHSTRTDFLAESVINSARGYRAMLQGRVSADSLKKNAPWNYDLTDTLSKFDVDLSPDIRTVAERLRRFDLISDGERSASSLKRESEAREQLALDLTLSRHIYAPHPFSTENSDADMDDEKEMIPPGVRLLLKDWDPVPTPIRRKQISTELPKERQTADVQRPPLIITSTSINQFDASRRFLSQDSTSSIGHPRCRTASRFQWMPGFQGHLKILWRARKFCPVRMEDAQQ